MKGVTRRPICFGGLLHIGNCIVTSFSMKAFGDTAHEVHRQIHYQQALMALHFLHSSNIHYSNIAMKAVIEGTGKGVPLKTKKERSQH